MTLPPTHRSLTVQRQRSVSPIVIVAAIVALAFLAVGALVVEQWAPAGHDTSVVTGFILGTLAPTIVGLLALVRGDHAVQQGKANAELVAATADTVEKVAENVNGHLERHQELAEKVTNVAEGIAAAAGIPVKVRDPASRTRGTDTTRELVVDQITPGLDAPPLAPDQS